MTEKKVTVLPRAVIIDVFAALQNQPESVHPDGFKVLNLSYKEGGVYETFALAIVCIRK